MARGNFNNHTKRQRELAKKDKRAAKDEKRAQKKADARAARASTVGTLPSTPSGAPTVMPADVSKVLSLVAAKE